jgi:hypothetical protein
MSTRDAFDSVPSNVRSIKEITKFINCLIDWLIEIDYHLTSNNQYLGYLPNKNKFNVTVGRWINRGNVFLLQPRNHGEMGRDDQFSIS